ncbi:Hypothetical predicted protein [Olea europaea subsp. europaea]|uniref:Uncharacterized protein n=1 Tax=Olea europaea subsp. europaea TaxID=158383 RepID=A0A8S0TFP0_OLEEU|nr:Hypothetical predicted protein [Olea europaea subsp. europaea]
MGCCRQWRRTRQRSLPRSPARVANAAEPIASQAAASDAAAATGSRHFGAATFAAGG